MPLYKHYLEIYMFFFASDADYSLDFLFVVW